MTLWYLFESTTKEISNTNLILMHLLLETTSKRLRKEEILFDVGINLRSKDLAMPGIRVMAKLDDIIY